MEVKVVYILMLNFLNIDSGMLKICIWYIYILDFSNCYSCYYIFNFL